MHQRRKGFTILEVTLAMAFISALILAVVFIGIQLTSLYNKGVTMRDVNTATRHLIRSLQDDIARSPGALQLADVVPRPGGALQTRVAKTLREATDRELDYYNDPESGGRLCTGVYTYVWNYRRSFIEYNKRVNNGTLPANGVVGKAQFMRSPTTRTFEPVRFTKLLDTDKRLCSATRLAENGMTDREFQEGWRLPNYSSAIDVVPIFGDSERNLVVYNIHITSPRELSYQSQQDPALSASRFYSSFYTINITIGSSLFDEEYMIDRSRIVRDSEVGSTHFCGKNVIRGDPYAEYCAINNIEFVARSGSL